MATAKSQSQNVRVELEGNSIQQLRKLASNLSIKGAHKFNKKDLVSSLMKAQTAQKRKEAAATAAKAKKAQSSASEKATKDKFISNDKPQIAASNVKAPIEVKLTRAQRSILESDIPKSEKFRKLSEAGLSKSQIARQTKSPYSFVHGALKRKQHAPTAN